MIDCTSGNGFSSHTHTINTHTHVFHAPIKASLSFSSVTWPLSVLRSGAPFGHTCAQIWKSFLNIYLLDSNLLKGKEDSRQTSRTWARYAWAGHRGLSHDWWACLKKSHWRLTVMWCTLLEQSLIMVEKKKKDFKNSSSICCHLHLSSERSGNRWRHCPLTPTHAFRWDQPLQRWGA